MSLFVIKMNLLTIYRRLRKFPRHELLGSRILEGNDLEPTWRNLMDLEDSPWLADHQILDDIVFPAAAFICMAGEASRQVSGSGDCTLQNFSIKTALVLKAGAKLELITSMRPLRLTDSLDSDAMEFSISSFNGAWVKHCSGQVKPGGAQPPSTKIEPFIRHVPRPYEGLKSIGLNYGPHFQGMGHTSADPGSNTASAVLLPPSSRIEDIYQIHPTTLDCCLQLFMIAISEGIPRRLDRCLVPTRIEELYIGRTTPNSEFLACATSSAAGPDIHGNLVMTTKNGDVVLSLKGGAFSPIESDKGETDNTAAAVLKWEPDIDFIPATQLIRPRPEKNVVESWLRVEELSILCMMEIDGSLALQSPVLPYLHRFQSWVSQQLQRTDDLYLAIKERKLGSAARRAMIEELSRQLLTGKAAAVATLVKRVFENCKDIFLGKLQPLELLLMDNGLTDYYNALDRLSDYDDFFSYLGHSNPRLRVLEIGAGTGGTTSRVLKCLTASSERLYSKYW